MRYLFVTLLGLFALQGQAAQLELVNMAGQTGRAAGYPSGFHNPRDLAVSPDGNKLYIADTDNNLVQVFNARNMKPLAAIGRGLLKRPYDVALDPQGHLYVADSGHDQILIFDVTSPLARRLGRLKRGFAEPKGIAFDRHGRILVSNARSHRIMLLSHNKPAVLKQFGGLGQDVGFFRAPQDIEVTMDGRILIADPGNRRLQVFSPNLAPMGTLEGGEGYLLRTPKSLAATPQGLLAVADPGQHRVLLFDGAFNLIGAVGNGRPGQGPFQLYAPEGVALHGAELWVSDTRSHRVLHYRLRP